MNSKEICAELRPKFTTVGLALLIYYGIMNLIVMGTMIVQALATLLPVLLTDPDRLLLDGVLDDFLDSLLNNGWGYLIATLVGALALLLWKKKQFFFKDIWQFKRPMKPGGFVMLLFVFLAAQAPVQLMTMLLEWLFNLFGLSVLDSLESMGGSANSFSMLLYMGIAAPIFEEILFRGFALRALQPYGKKFAIFGSAFLFGMFHGNIIQTPFAFLVGLILGYVTVEYSIIWAVVLHTINNLVLGDFLTRIIELLPPLPGEILFVAVIWGSFLAAVIILLAKRKQIADYFAAPKIHPLCIKSFFTSPGILLLTGVMGLNIILTFLMIFLA